MWSTNLTEHRKHCEFKSDLSYVVSHYVKRIKVRLSQLSTAVAIAQSQGPEVNSKHRGSRREGGKRKRESRKEEGRMSEQANN